MILPISEDQQNVLRMLSGGPVGLDPDLRLTDLQQRGYIRRMGKSRTYGRTLYGLTGIGEAMLQRLPRQM